MFTIPEEASADQLESFAEFMEASRGAGHEPTDSCDTCITYRDHIMKGRTS